ncbi:MAG TPA: hypothetical protein VF459_03990 [Caulobacteraceae bacterium]
MTLADPSWPPGPRQKQCWRCAEVFACGPRQPGQACWCDAVPALPVIDPQADCLCPACLASAVETGSAGA